MVPKRGLKDGHLRSLCKFLLLQTYWRERRERGGGERMAGEREKGGEIGYKTYGMLLRWIRSNVVGKPIETLAVVLLEMPSHTAYTSPNIHSNLSSCGIVRS
jgi:hypothetical protein